MVGEALQSQVCRKRAAGSVSKERDKKTIVKKTSQCTAELTLL